MNIVYHASNSFAKVVTTSIVSIFENNQDIEEITIYIIERGFTQSDKEMLCLVAKSYRRKIEFIKMPDINKSEHLNLKKVKEKWVFDSYCRLFLDKLLPETVNRVLYLDGDVLNTGSLYELWNTNMEGLCAAAVIDCIGEKYYNVLGLSEEARYCNSGVILFDLTEWRKRGIGEKVRNYVNEKNGYVYFMEQTVFNAIMQGKIKILHPRYNTYSMMQALSYEEIMKLRRVERYYSKEEIHEALISPILVHMTSSFWIVNRPWNKVTTHPMRDEYKKYALLTPWREPFEQDKRDGNRKIVDWFVQNLPRCVVISIASFLYNEIRVKQIKKEIKKYRQNI